MVEDFTFKYPIISLEELEKEGKIRFLKGQGVSKKDFDDGGKNYCIHYGDLYTQYITPTITKVIHKTNISGRVLSKYGDVLVPGTTTADAMGIAIARALDEDGVILGGDINIIRTNNSYLLAKFLAFVLSYTLKAELASHAKGTNILHLYNKDIKKIKVPVPTIEKQKEFVELFEKVSERIDRMKANAKFTLSATKDLFESYINDTFTKLEQTNKKYKICEIAEIKGGKRIPKGLKLTRDETKHPYIRVADFNEYGTVDLSDIHYITEDIFKQIKNYTISPKDLYISIAGTIGKAGIIPASLDGANLTENACKLVFRDNIYNKFVYYFTKTKTFIDETRTKTRTAAQPKLALTRLSTIQLPIPDIEKQKAMVGNFDRLSLRIQELQQIYSKKIKLLDDLKQSILKQAFAGEL